ncbi:hypothetical protein D3C79_1057560 [compost metagenome]
MLALLVRIGFHAQGGQGVELRGPVLTVTALQALELGPFIIGQAPGLGLCCGSRLLQRGLLAGLLLRFNRGGCTPSRSRYQVDGE